MPDYTNSDLMQKIEELEKQNESVTTMLNEWKSFKASSNWWRTAIVGLMLAVASMIHNDGRKTEKLDNVVISVGRLEDKFDKIIETQQKNYGFLRSAKEESKL